MFHQAMCVLYGDGYKKELGSDKLKDALVYIDFSGIFSRRRWAHEVLEKNPLFLEESIFTNELSAYAEGVRKKYALGQLLVSGDNRYLSDDLIRLLAYIVKTSVGDGEAHNALEAEELHGSEIYAPSPAYEVQGHYTLLRSPHIARNEEAFVRPIAKVGPIRGKYLSHLYYVLMVDSRSLIPERLGGADYDGDMIKTVADPIVNRCVARGYEDGKELPVLKIPAAEPLIADANRKEETDWVVLPVANFCAYYGSMTFEKTYLPGLPEDIFIRDRRDGVSIFKVDL